MPQVARLIRTARKQTGCTLEQIAATTVRSVAHIREIEGGKIQGTPETLRAIAAVLGIKETVMQQAYISDAMRTAAYLWSRETGEKVRQSVTNKSIKIRSKVT